MIEVLPVFRNFFNHALRDEDRNTHPQVEDFLVSARKDASRSHSFSEKEFYEALFIILMSIALNHIAAAFLLPTHLTCPTYHSRLESSRAWVPLTMYHLCFIHFMSMLGLFWAVTPVELITYDLTKGNSFGF